MKLTSSFMHEIPSLINQLADLYSLKLFELIKFCDSHLMNTRLMSVLYCYRFAATKLSNQLTRLAKAFLIQTVRAFYYDVINIYDASLKVLQQVPSIHTPTMSHVCVWEREGGTSVN